MAPHDHDIDVLNSLIAATLDNVHRYDQAQMGADNPQVKQLFARRVIERRLVTVELQTKVRRLLGSKDSETVAVPDMSSPFGSTLTAANRQSDRHLVDQIEAGEVELRLRYSNALADSTLSGPVRNLAQRAYELIKIGHGEMLNLRRLI